jgi:hypothetical protein
MVLILIPALISSAILVLALRNPGGGVLLLPMLVVLGLLAFVVVATFRVAWRMDEDSEAAGRSP